MKTPPNHQDHDPLSEALRRDAARVQDPPFDPVQHQAMLRRIHAMEGSGHTRWWRKPVLTGAAIAVVALCIGWWLPRASHLTEQPVTALTTTARHTAPQHTAPAPRPDFTAVLASTQRAVDHLSSAASSPLPAWISPTAALLDPPYLPSINIEHQQ
jgi:hypothetical protein